MKTKKEMISHYSSHFQKVLQSWGAESDKTTYAFFLLQAVKNNFEEKDIFDWAMEKCKSLESEFIL